MAEQFASSDAGSSGTQLRATWRAEQTAAAKRRQAHWQLVQQKKQLAEQLRQELRQREAAQQQALAARDRAYSDYLYYGGSHSDYLHCCTVYSNATASKGRTQAELNSALEAPDPVIQPLPAHQDLAYRWLFFLYMPPMLR